MAVYQKNNDAGHNLLTINHLSTYLQSSNKTKQQHNMHSYITFIHTHTCICLPTHSSKYDLLDHWLTYVNNKS